jgi:Heavy metal binding domain
MKYTATISAILIIATVIGGCTQTTKKTTAETTIIADTANSKTVAAVYQCPMDCENGKTYAYIGKCPVCEMDLEKK